MNSKSIQMASRKGWESDRLIYRALEDNETDRSFIHDAIAGDPEGFALAYCEAFRPQSGEMVAGICAMLRKKCLSVVICLPEKAIETSDEKPEDGAKGTGGTYASRRARSVSIGTLTLTAAEPENHHHRKTTLGISIIKDYQGHGYGPEAINWALDWAFQFGGMHRVSLSCYGYNDRAQRTYKKLGFREEGRVRECLWFNRAWHDEILFGVLESEWVKLRSSAGDMV